MKKSESRLPLLCLSLAALALPGLSAAQKPAAQSPATPAPSTPQAAPQTAPAADSAQKPNRASAYYHAALADMYEEQA